MAGLSVAFDASCEEMWLAWRSGACLVPAPRSLVRSGMDLGPWLVANDITVVSTVPTLLLLWPVESLARVRLLILGGEACPPEIGTRFATAVREVWNTYGPTEATVVACGAPVVGGEPVRIGLPLDGWDLAVVDAANNPVAPGESGELIIGGVGLARYLDPALDAAKYAPMPSLGWTKAYRSGDLVRHDEQGLVFLGRADDQVKIGGRRIELGEIDNALLALPGVTGAAAAVRTTRAGNSLLVGYVAVEDTFDPGAALARLRAELPAAMVPRLAPVDTLPTKTSGKIDRDALPWPLPVASGAGRVGARGDGGLAPGALGRHPRGRHERRDRRLLRPRRQQPDGRAAGEQAPGALSRGDRGRHLRAPHGGGPGRRARRDGDAGVAHEPVGPPGPAQDPDRPGAFTIPLRTLAGLRWLTLMAAVNNVAVAVWQLDWLPTVSWGWVVLGWLLLVWSPGRMALAAAGARFLLRGVTPGSYPRGGKVHLRLWLAERLADEMGAANLAGAVWIRHYARALGARVGTAVDLHSIPPVTGLLDLGDRCSVEPEVDLRGHWLDGDVLRIGRVDVGADARIGARSMLAPGASIGPGAEVAPGSAVFGEVPAGEAWSGAPAQRAACPVDRGRWSVPRTDRGGWSPTRPWPGSSPACRTWRC